MNKQNIPKKILYWYDNNKRILPWRKNVSKKQKQYFTLISEFMLQQTQVKTVIPYFENFINKIPNLKSLAKVNNKKLFIAIFIIFCFGWNQKTAITGDVASFPGYRIPVKIINKILFDHY